MARTPGRHVSCPRCGGRLARDNTSGRCAPCQAAERDRLTTPPTLPATFWDHEPIRQALTERHLGRIIRAYRCHPYHGRHPLPQQTVARWLGIAQAQLSRIENGRPIVHLDRLTHWARILRIPAHLLWFKLPEGNSEYRQGPALANLSGHLTSGMDRPPNSAVTVRDEPDYGGDTTNRRSFVITAALVSLGVPEHLRSLLASADPPPRLGEEHIRSVMSVVNGFEHSDATIGGNNLCDVAIALHRQLTKWECECTYDRRVGDALQAALGDLECWIGWFALDAERRLESRKYLKEAILRARLRDDPQLEVRALQSMSMLVRQARPKISLQCADAALRLSTGWATPRLSTLLHLRAARANAELGNAIGFSREMAKALSAFERGERDDDPLYIRFVNPMEISGIEAQSYLALGNPTKAVRSYQALIDNAVPEYRRNQAFYSVNLANAKLRQGDVDSASQIAISATPTVTSLRSKRTSLLLANLRTALGSHTSRSNSARQFTAIYDEAMRA